MRCEEYKEERDLDHRDFMELFVVFRDNFQSQRAER
jgi:hypothetical protein